MVQAMLSSGVGRYRFLKTPLSSQPRCLPVGLILEVVPVEGAMGGEQRPSVTRVIKTAMSVKRSVLAMRNASSSFLEGYAGRRDRVPRVDHWVYLVVQEYIELAKGKLRNV